mmetsp:Transcript_10134/g.29499  ORF Transcript_10134/g.29499 Transcript_10134/m.29499 type:complete len:226 (-) Transcript_10134:411-1088(-)
MPRLLPIREAFAAARDVPHLLAGRPADQLVIGDDGCMPSEDARLRHKRLRALLNGAKAREDRRSREQGTAALRLVAIHPTLRAATATRDDHHGPQPWQQSRRLDGQRRHHLARRDFGGAAALGMAERQHRLSDVGPPSLRHALHARAQAREPQGVRERRPSRASMEGVPTLFEEGRPLLAHSLHELAHAGHPIEAAGCRPEPLRRCRFHDLVAELVQRQEKVPGA